jgi:signal transduction histidine kinase
LQKKIALGLLLIVVLPVALLTWVGLRAAGHEQAAFEHQLQGLMMDRLKAVDETIQRTFLDRQTMFLADAAKLDFRSDRLRAYTQNSLYAHHALLMEAGNGNRLFPPQGQPLSEAEQAFLRRTASIWADPQKLAQSAPLPLAQSQNASSSRPPADGAPNPFGWYAWYWNAELHCLFWVRGPGDRIIGFELEPLRATSDIIAALPATGDARHVAEGRIRLRDANGAVLYQWGPYEPSDTQAVAAVLPLSHPLGSWKLEYFREAAGAGGQTSRFTLWTGVLAVTLVLIGLGYYLYREHSREMRLAAQRVNFVNQVSHELRTPLTNIRMYAELLDDELADSHSTARKYIDVISVESSRLSRLITNVLNFAQVQRGRLQIQLRPGSVDQTVARCLEVFKPALSARQVTVEWDAQAGATVMLDQEALEQILNNLLSNVEKYGMAGGKLEIRSRQEGDRTVITIRDFGPGIPKQEWDRVFQPFYRISSKLTDGVAGAGMGLGIARDLARLHGGDVTLVPVEQGACFQIVLTTQQPGTLS